MCSSLQTVACTQHECCLPEEEMHPKLTTPSYPGAVEARWFYAILFLLSLVFRVLGSLLRARRVYLVKSIDWEKPSPAAHFVGWQPT